MGKVNVYLPDDLEAAARQAGLPLSPVCQAALRRSLDVLHDIRTTGIGPYSHELRAILDGLRDDHATVRASDVWVGVVEHGDNLGVRVLTSLGIELPAAVRRARRPAGGGDLSAEARDLLADAYRVSLEMRHDQVGPEHVVVATAAEGSELADVYLALGVDQRSIRQQVERLLADPWSTERPDPVEDRALLERLDREVQRLAAELGRLKGDD